MPARVALASFHPLIFIFKYVCPQKNVGRNLSASGNFFFYCIKAH